MRRWIAIGLLILYGIFAHGYHVGRAVHDFLHAVPNILHHHESHSEHHTLEDHHDSIANKGEDLTGKINLLPLKLFFLMDIAVQADEQSKHIKELLSAAPSVYFDLYKGIHLKPVVPPPRNGMTS